jgi:hypothetical protein
MIGSQDLTEGFAPGDNDSTAGSNCVRDLMVRTYDVAAGARSNLLDVTAGC